MEHYLEVYSTQNAVSDAAFGSITLLPPFVELDEEPSMHELSRAIEQQVPG